MNLLSVVSLLFMIYFTRASGLSTSPIAGDYNVSSIENPLAIVNKPTSSSQEKENDIKNVTRQDIIDVKLLKSGKVNNSKPGHQYCRITLNEGVKIKTQRKVGLLVAKKDSQGPHKHHVVTINPEDCHNDGHCESFIAELPDTIENGSKLSIWFGGAGSILVWPRFFWIYRSRPFLFFSFGSFKKVITQK